MPCEPVKGFYCEKCVWVDVNHFSSFLGVLKRKL